MKRPLVAHTPSVPDKRLPPGAVGVPDCLPEAVSTLAGVDEAVWIEVIQKMDEVYNDLLQYEVVLEEKNAALEDSQQFIESVLASMSDILIVCNRHGAIDEVNDSLRRFIGLDEGELRGRPVCDLFADEASRQRARDFFSAARPATVQDCELRIMGRDGSPLPVSLNCTPRLSGTGKLVGMVLTGRPVGELRRAYHALRQAHEDLKRTQQQLLQAEKMASLGRLVAGVAHELNNPISFVLGNVLAIRRYTARLQTYLEAVHREPGERASELEELRQELRIDRILQDLNPLLDGMTEGAERTRDIVDGLKRFSAIDRSAEQAFNLASVVERAVRWVARSGLRDFAVKADFPNELPVIGSSGQMQQVLMNIVQNRLCRAEPRNQRRAARRDDRPALRRQWPGNHRGQPGAPVRSLLHYQAGRAGDRSRAVDQLRHCRTARWPPGSGEPAAGGRPVFSEPAPGAALVWLAAAGHFARSDPAVEVLVTDVSEAQRRFA